MSSTHPFRRAYDISPPKSTCEVVPAIDRMSLFFNDKSWGILFLLVLCAGGWGVAFWCSAAGLGNGVADPIAFHPHQFQSKVRGVTGVVLLSSNSNVLGSIVHTLKTGHHTSQLTRSLSRSDHGYLSKRILH